jgi:hypothetical protein
MIVLRIFLILKCRIYKHDENGFYQNGVRVLYAEKKIMFKGKSYDIDKVRVTTQYKYNSGKSYIFFYVDDFDHPQYKIRFYGARYKSGLSKCTQRIQLAMDKAKGWKS